MTASTAVVICEPLRTPVGRMGGALAPLSATELATVALVGMIARADVLRRVESERTESVFA